MDSATSVFGQTVTFTAAVAAAGNGSGTPTGTVTFKEGSTRQLEVRLGRILKNLSLEWK